PASRWLARGVPSGFNGMPLAAQIITFLPPARGGAFGCGCAVATLVVCAIASDAEVTANPERKSLRFMEPHLIGDLKDAENITLHSWNVESYVDERRVCGRVSQETEAISPATRQNNQQLWLEVEVKAEPVMVSDDLGSVRKNVGRPRSGRS